MRLKIGDPHAAHPATAKDSAACFFVEQFLLSKAPAKLSDHCMQIRII
jgi:hypothetical protein